MFKISKTWLVIIIIIALVVGYSAIKSALKSPTDGLVLEKVTRGNVLQEVSETGSVKATENVSLGFKTVGKVARINVAVGDDVKKGDILAELDVSQILAQLQAARASLDYTANQYNSTLDSAKNDLQNAYNSAQNTLNDAYTKIYNAYTSVVELEGTYFGMNDQESIRVSFAKNDINSKMTAIKQVIDSKSDTDIALSTTYSSLEAVRGDIEIIRAQCESGVYYSRVSATDKASMDTQKAYINTALSSITTAQSGISSYKIALKRAEEKAAGNAGSDTSSQIKQAQANIAALQSQLNDNYIVSPINGKVTNVSIKRGQIVSLAQSAINLLSTDPFEIKVAVYEQDIVNVKVGNDVKIDLVAFPKNAFLGKVLSIDPAETIIDNVVYYEITIDFPDQPEGIRSGMTADITIETNKKDNVLMVPKNVVQNLGGKDLVQVVKNGKIENREIITGLEGNEYYEVLSGLSDGDTIITGKK
jgi:HlyD family secretion protein